MSDRYPQVNLAGTGYELDGSAIFSRTFRRAMSFHAPEGLAAVWDDTGAYHIATSGLPAYAERYHETFGFYEGIATARDANGYLHVSSSGRPVHESRFVWAGNFQEGLCPAQDGFGFFHVRRDGAPAYAQRYAYVGDFVHGVAVVHDEGRAWHILSDGARLHDKNYRNAGVYHKGAAVVEDDAGAFHVGTDGVPLHGHRFRTAEPFYNGVALCTDDDGRRIRLCENGFYSLAAGPSRCIAAPEILEHIATGGTAALLLRHAEREPIAGGWGDDARLTDRGQAQALRLGRSLARTHSLSLLSSPVERCRQTAEGLAVGAGHAAVPVVTDLLGAPGPFRDPVRPAAILPEEFGSYATRYLESGRAPGMRPLEEACEHLLREMRASAGVGLSVLVSHDLFVAGLARFLGLKWVHRDDWADFLEGVCVLESPGEPIRYRMFHGLREIGAC